MKIVDERPQYLVTRISEYLESMLLSGRALQGHYLEATSLLQEARDTLQHLLEEPAVREMLGHEKSA